MIKDNLRIFSKFFGCGVVFSFIAIVITFFMLAYTAFMDITVLILLGIVWFFVGILPSFLTAVGLMLRPNKRVNYTQLFIIQCLLAISFILGFIVWTGELKGIINDFDVKLLLSFSAVVVSMGVVSGLVAMASGFLSLINPKNNPKPRKF